MAVDGINKGVGVNSVNTNKKTITKSEDKKPNKSLSKTAKYMIGAAALATIAIAGIATHKTIQTNNLKKSIAELKDNITKIPELQKSYYPDYERHFDGSLLEGHISEAEKLPLKQQYEKLNDIYRHSDITPEQLVQKEHTVEYLQNPKLPQEILETKDPYIIGKEYDRIMNERTFRSCVSGNTVQETVENVFGKNSSVMPHSYDISKEPDYILTQATYGGFKKFGALKDGNYAHVTRTGAKGINPTIIPEVHTAALEPKAGEKFAISRTKDGVVMKVVEDNSKKFKTKAYSFAIPNVGSELTPMQRDLLSIKDKITPEDLDTFSRLFYGGSPTNVETLWVGQQTNYDAIASVIQTIAKRA